MTDEGLEHLLETEQPRLPIDQGDHVDAEDGLERRLGVEVVEHHLGVLAAAQLDDDTHAVFVGLVAQAVARDAVDQFVADQVRDAFDETRLVDLIGKLGDHDGLPVALAADLFEVRPATDREATAAALVGGGDLLRTVDDASGREVGARHMLHERRERHRRIVDHGNAGVDDLGEVVGRDVGGHAHGDARRPVDQQVRVTRRHDARLGERFVVVRDEIDGLAVEVRKQFAGDARHAHLGVSHRRGHIAIDRAEIALAVDQQVAHGERLRHAYDGVVHGVVTVRVVLTDDIADDAGGFLVGFVVVVAEFAHGVEHPAVHGLQAVPHIRQRPPDDDAHRVIEVGLAHLVFEVDGNDFACEFTHSFEAVLQPKTRQKIVP